jgi:uncharacterized membrane protein YccF (DUF307 family)
MSNKKIYARIAMNRAFSFQKNLRRVLHVVKRINPEFAPILHFSFFSVILIQSLIQMSECGLWSGLKLFCWWLFGGLFTAIAWWIIGAAFCLTIIGIPFGKQCFKMSSLCLHPFDKEIYRHGSCFGSDGFCGCLGNILWLPIGLVIAAFHFILAAVFFVSLIGIPCAGQHLKLADLAIWPFGSEAEEERPIIHQHYQHQVPAHHHVVYPQQQHHHPPNHQYSGNQFV